MAVIKCKMCGGSLDVEAEAAIAQCEYCGTKQTIPSQDSEKKLALFARADRLRRSGEFDKAAGVYENIVSEFPEEAEAYWGLVLCRYGIEYVDDPGTGKKVPTCHRSSFDSVLEDEDFEQACENADPIARRLYREEAKAIEELRRGILEVSGREEPYDVFLCYKETDEAGQRTPDSVMAQEVYDALTGKGRRVFFARISLEDKLGTQYEPYIFAALNSARIMLVFGTDFEYFNAVWVKNEWSRFLALMAAGQKKVLIPCYRGIDAYDMPKEFAKLQGQDMGRLGAVQDLVRGVEKLLDGGTAAPAKETVVVSGGGPDVSALMERGRLSLEDEDWAKAAELFDQILSIAPKSGEAYLGLAMARLRLRDREAFGEAYAASFDGFQNDKQVARAKQFAEGELKALFAQLDTEKAQREAVLSEQTQKQLQQKKLDLADSRRKIAPGQLIAAGGIHTAVLRADGTVIATKNLLSYCESGQSNTADWHNIIAVAAGTFFTVGLRADGTVVATAFAGDSKNYYGQCDVSSWRGIVSVACGFDYVVGLKADSTVVAAGNNKFGQCEVGDWSGIVEIAAKNSYTIGLREDGTVVVAGKSIDVRYEASKWTNIVAVAAGQNFVAGLHIDGTVVVAGEENDKDAGWRTVGGWSNIVALSMGLNQTVGLRADGTVVAVMNQRFHENGNAIEDLGTCNVEGWRDIAAISAGNLHTIGLKKDGTLVAAGYNGYGACEVSGWRLFHSADTIEREFTAPQPVQTAPQPAGGTRLEEIRRELGALEAELAALGFFDGKRKREIRARMSKLVMEEVELEQDN